MKKPVPRGFDRALVRRIAEQSGFVIADVAALPARAAKRAAVPSGLAAKVRTALEEKYPSGLYEHQARSLDAALNGHDISLSTATASGKSLVFIAFACHLLQRRKVSRVLALYPARALIQDQIGKWREWAQSLGISVGRIDGGVPVATRLEILTRSQVVLMTPDVAQAWLLSNLAERQVRGFLSELRLLVLDEAHVYDGVFGTNMAYFLRRLEVASSRYQVICSTATLGEPAAFVEQMTGRRPTAFTLDDDGSEMPEKTVLLAAGLGRKSLDGATRVLLECTKVSGGRFLAFGDSRRLVEQVVAIVHRSITGEEDEESTEAKEGGAKDKSSRPMPVLPYRAGYEDMDRREIQRALEQGTLTGVVTTSALELGLDIGDIELIVLLDVPPSVKAFWQRIGRAGRRHPGVCLLIDGRGLLGGGTGSLARYLSRPLEPSWLYLENRYIQYTNALCAALELSQMGEKNTDHTPFASLPESFRKMLGNELHPAEVIPPDLYMLKQRAQAGPHYEFPVRQGIEQQFRVTESRSGQGLGSLTFSQVLREAYPGAIYYYMAQPYRVATFNFSKGQITVHPERRWTTRPIAQAMVFPRFRGGVLNLALSDRGFVAECEVQVSERVLGFVEQRGSAKQEQRYGSLSPYWQRELTRFFETTGVCWYFQGGAVLTEAAARQILAAFCLRCGVQERDLGVGRFHAKDSPLGEGVVQGLCVFDATNGSLRLSQRLVEEFETVLNAAVTIASSDGDSAIAEELKRLQRLACDLQRVRGAPGIAAPQAGEEDTDWARIIAPGERAIYQALDGAREVRVRGYRYTPRGLMYELEPPPGMSDWLVNAAAIQEIHGETKVIRVNLVTGETSELNT